MLDKINSEAAELPLGPDVSSQVAKKPRPTTLPAVREPEPPPADDDDGEFDWNHADAIVLREQQMVAAYFNPNGDLVIRQRSWPDDDPYIVIAANNIEAFIDRLTDILGYASAGHQ